MDTMSSESLQSLIARHQASPHALVQILREAQTLQGWLPREYLVEIAGALGLALAHVQGVAGFYRFLHTRPVGTYRVLFSNNITDRMLGNEALMRDLCERLGVTRGQVRADGRVSIELASCTGLCDQGPALLVNHHQIVTRLNPGRIEHIAALIEAQVPPAQWPPEWSRVDDQIRLTDVKLGTQPAPGEALAAAIARGPQGMLDDLKRSKLRGRGGAGYATATKWQLCRNAPGADPLCGLQRRRGRTRHLQGPGAADELCRPGVIEGMTIGALGRRGAARADLPARRVPLPAGAPASRVAAAA
jgi:[NiFe] hydrogenase diaphorase moiety large subunit